MQNMQKRRVQYALTQVVQASTDESINNQEYNSAASGFPAMIRMNGLGQAAAFYRSPDRSQAAYKHLYDLLSTWLQQPGQPYENKDLLDGIRQHNMRTYQVAQVEALEMLNLVKQYAKAFMEDE